jgi:transposase-like protein
MKANLDISVSCPFCGSTATRREADFGTTLAYAQYYCHACRNTHFGDSPEKMIEQRLLNAFANVVCLWLGDGERPLGTDFFD